MQNKTFDVLIIGAGAAGLMAAKELAASGKKVAVIEAKNRIGGRMLTLYKKGFDQPAEAGAAFVHGDLPITKGLLKEAGAKIITASGSIWQHSDGSLQQQEDFIEDMEALEQKCGSLKEDIPVADFINAYLNEPQLEDLRTSLKNYAEGYYAADLQKASAKAMCQELAEEDEDQYFIEGGYALLIAYLEKQCTEAGVAFFLSQPVWQLHWQKGKAEAITNSETFTAQKALITVSVGVLQAEGITFFPALPHKTAAARALGFGHVVKIVLSFKEAFWKNKKHTEEKDLHDLNFLFSEARLPTWWTQHPQGSNLLTGWLAGPKAIAYKDCSEDQIIETALQSLSTIFKISIQELQQLLHAAATYNWSADPFTNGAYSYQVVNGEAHMQTILQPEKDTLYFAGEGLHHGPEIGTVEAALKSGKEAAERAGRS